jgi:hypothetical protein
MNAKPKIADPVRGLSRLMWPSYSPGLLLQDDDLTQAVTYTRELSRLMFRTLFGFGVLCGLVVTFVSAACGKLKFTIDKGVALDCEGDPIEVPEQQAVTIDRCTADGQPKQLSELWFVLCRYDKCCAPRSTSCGSDDDQIVSVHTRERDGFEIRVVDTRPECACGCHPKEIAVDSADAAEKESPASKSAAANAGDKKAKAVESDPRYHCVDCQNECHHDHYAGKCPCDCCDCDCIILACASKRNGQDVWDLWHNVRRFVRPVLMRDPQVEIEEKARQQPKKDDEKGKEGKDEDVSQQRETKAPRRTETPPKRSGRER